MRTPPNLRMLWLALPVLSLALTTAAAQETTSLSGTVTDATGGVIPGVELTLTDEETGATRVALSDDRGRYAFSQLSPGTYRLKAEIEGFKTAVLEDLVLLVATPTRQDVRLEIGAVSEVVMVESSASTLNLEDASHGNPFSELQLKQLPVQARNPVGLLALEPGVVLAGGSDFDQLLMGSVENLDSRDGVVNGVRGNQTNVTLDGVAVNDQETQAAFASILPVSVDSLQEFRVTTTNAAAAEGVSGGAQVALVTKSGSNDWHGNLRWFHRNDATAANSFFNNLNELDKPKLIRNLPGASVGGPIKKDRIFVFLDYEGRRDRSETNVSRIVPGDAFRNGGLVYECDPDDPLSAALCPDGTFTLTRQQLALIDPRPQDGSSVCDPNSVSGCGVNPFMLSYWSQFPMGNDPTQGLDAGLNFTGFRFNSPVNTDNNLYTARVDFNLDRQGNHTLFWRGSLADIRTDILPAQFPGLDPNAVLLNNGRGFVTTYTGQVSPRLINTFRYGYTRGGIEQTGAPGTEFAVRSFDTHLGFNRAFGRIIPIHEFKNDLTWLKGNHTIQAGFNYRRTRTNRFTEDISFPRFFVNNGFCLDLCRDAFDAVVADPTVPAPVNANVFTRGYNGLTGPLTQIEASFFVDPASGTFLPSGSRQARTFGENNIEWYVQDTWRVRPNFSVTLGVRHSYFGPIWETDGVMVAPTVDVERWFNDRAANFRAGIPADANPLLAFDLAGKSNGRDAWWSPDWNNFSPRIALAWSPAFDGGLGRALFGGPGKSSVRAGFGVYYQRLGGALAVATDVNGSPGLANGLINAASDFSLASAPRFSGTCGPTGCSGLPDPAGFLPVPTSAAFPATPAANASNLGFVVDNELRTPYSMNTAFSIQRELPGKVVFDVGYVGVLGRKLPAKIDYAMIGGILTDPASGQTLWDAYQQVVDALGPDIFAPPDVSTVTFTAPFIENMMPNLPALAGDFFGVDPNTITPTQAFYLFAAAFAPTWVDPLFFVFDVFPSISPWRADLDPEGDGFVLQQPQFQALPGWIGWGSSNFHSLQVSANRRFGNAHFAFNYVLSKSLDNGSAAENADLLGPGVDSFQGFVQNAFDPGADRSFSDFDLRHNFNANWLFQLPFGRGQRYGASMSAAADHLIGGWQVTGAWRWRSGFPVSAFPDFAFATSFFIQPPVEAAGSTGTSVTSNDPNGLPNLFSNPDQARQSFRFTRPGGSGSRNVLRVDDFFTVDLGLAKTWNLPWGEGHRIQFRWELFNAFNSVNFDDGTGLVGVPGVDTVIDNVRTFGRFFATTPPREMQFALRYEF